MNIFTRIIEKVFKLEKEEVLPCASCERLHLLLEQERVEKGKLLSVIISKGEPAPATTSVTKEPIKPSFIPWHVRKQQLEAQDRVQAKILRDLQNVDKEIEDANKISATVQVDGNESPREGQDEGDWPVQERSEGISQ